MTVQETMPHKVHAITRTCDQADIADGVQRTKLVERERFVHEMYRHKLHGAEPTVDASHEFIYRSAKILIFLDILARRHSQLDENDLGGSGYRIS